MSVIDKANTHHTVRMGKEGFVTIAEVQPPDLDVLIRACSHDELVV